MLLSGVFISERGISESNKDLKFECRSVHDFRPNRTQRVAVKLSLLLVISNLVVNSLLRKNVKLVIKYVQLYEDIKHERDQ